jgi:hypothetical protein
MKNFVKASDMNGPAFTYLHEKFPRLNAEKIKAGVFIRPQIRQLFKDDYIECVLSDTKKTAWKSFQNVLTGLLGNVTAANFRQLVENLLNSYKKTGVQHVTEDALLALTPGFLPTKLWCRQQRTW